MGWEGGRERCSASSSIRHGNGRVRAKTDSEDSCLSEICQQRLTCMRIAADATQIVTVSIRKRLEDEPRSISSYPQRNKAANCGIATFNRSVLPKVKICGQGDRDRIPHMLCRGHAHNNVRVLNDNPLILPGQETAFISHYNGTLRIKTPFTRNRGSKRASTVKNSCSQNSANHALLQHILPLPLLFEGSQQSQQWQTSRHRQHIRHANTVNGVETRKRLIAPLCEIPCG